MFHHQIGTSSGDIFHFLFIPEFTVKKADDPNYGVYTVLQMNGGYILGCAEIHTEEPFKFHAISYSKLEKRFRLALANLNFDTHWSELSAG